MKKILILFALSINFCYGQMTISNGAATKADLQGRIPADGEWDFLGGNSTFGDMQVEVWRYDASSSATDNFDLGVIKPTAQGGNGRWLRRVIDNPVGSIEIVAHSNTPLGYLLCDGSAVSRTTYAKLFNAIGTTYGVGDGSTTFNLPNCKGRFPLGKADAGTGSTLGETGGELDHDHTVDPPNTTTSAPSATIAATNLTGSAANPTHTHDVNIAQFNSGINNPAYITFYFYIKY